MASPLRTTKAIFSAETPLHDSLNHLALSHTPSDDLLNEDLSLEDSFEFIDTRKDATAGSSTGWRNDHIAGGRGEEADDGIVIEKGNADERVYSYTGSMGVLPSVTAATLPTASTRGQIHLSSSTNEEEVEEDEEDEEGLPEEDVKRRKELREERDGLRVMNTYLAEILAGLEAAEGKMKSFEGTIATTQELLELYVKICSQAEHTQSLILDRSWGGVVADIEAQAALEALEAQKVIEAQAAAEKAQLEQQAREKAKIEAETLAKKNAATPSRRGAPIRGRPIVRGSTRGLSSSSTAASTSTSGISRGSGIGVTGVRGVRGLRSRAAPRGRGTSLTE